MKYVLLLFLLPGLLRAQDKIEGLGKFKIGKTTPAIIEEVAKELNCKVGIATMAAMIDENGFLKPSVYKLEIDPKLPATITPPQHVFSCPTTRTFFINKYTIAGMKVMGLYLIFNEQKLVKLICQASGEINEALTLKYGNAPASSTNDTIQCVSPQTGLQTAVVQLHGVRAWQNGSIQAENTANVLYDKQCNPYSQGNLIIWDSILLQAQQTCENEADRQAEAKRKEKLKDF